tara:strand:- start:680 stop:874 length:195 start_codon:yes stop_codon:yes gene_type:complete
MATTALKERTPAFRARIEDTISALEAAVRGKLSGPLERQPAKQSGIRRIRARTRGGFYVVRDDP